MIPPLKFAAIDIGSNAVRLLFSNVAKDHLGKVHFHKVTLIRVPVRLGSDTFVNGNISEAKMEDMVKTMTAYRQLIEVYRVNDYMAFATSALREAKNGAEVAAYVSDKSGINIQVIDGDLEAEVIHATHAEEDLDKSKNYLYIDVGGGSTELTLIIKGKREESRSFRIGTVRMLEGLVKDEEWEHMQDWIRIHASGFDDELSAIGTGGNINKIFKLTGAKDGKPITRRRIQRQTHFLESFSLEDRVNILGLREDRADVIIPASNIYLNVMKWANIRQIYVPKLGLADGMVHLMYEKWKKENV